MVQLNTTRTMTYYKQEQKKKKKKKNKKKKKKKKKKRHFSIYQPKSTNKCTHTPDQMSIKTPPCFPNSHFPLKTLVKLKMKKKMLQPQQKPYLEKCKKIELKTWHYHTHTHAKQYSAYRCSAVPISTLPKVKP